MSAPARQGQSNLPWFPWKSGWAKAIPYPAECIESVQEVPRERRGTEESEKKRRCEPEFGSGLREHSIFALQRHRTHLRGEDRNLSRRLRLQPEISRFEASQT